MLKDATMSVESNDGSIFIIENLKEINDEEYAYLSSISNPLPVSDLVRIKLNRFEK